MITTTFDAKIHCWGVVLMELMNLDKLNWRFFTLSVSSSGELYFRGHIELVVDGAV